MAQAVLQVKLSVEADSIIMTPIKEALSEQISALQLPHRAKLQ